MGMPQVLHGLGGIGKTQLALHYVYQYSKTYKLVWWVRAEVPETLAADYAALAGRLGLPQHAAQDQQEAIAAVRKWLEGNRNWLLILDNAPDPAAVYAYLPRSSHGHTIITSPHFGWGATAHVLTVPVFPRQEATKLLLKVTRHDDLDAADAIANTLGDLPLAVAQAADYIVATGMSLSAYHQRLEQNLSDYLSRGEGGLDYPATVATTWNLAFEALQINHPDAIDLLRLCAFFAPDNIPHALLRHLPSLFPEGLSQVVAEDRLWDDTLMALRRYSLIERGDKGDEALSIHRLVQTVTRDRLSQEERLQWAETAMACVAALFSSGNAVDDPRNWPEYARLFPHASSILRWIDEEKNVNSELLLQMGSYLQRRAQFKEAQPYFERALDINEQVRGPEHPVTAQSLNNLGALLQDQGDFSSAQSYLAQALDIREQVLGANHPATAQSLNSLGRLLQAQGDLSSAQSYYERAFQIFRLCLGQDHEYTQMVLANLESLETDA